MWWTCSRGRNVDCNVFVLLAPSSSSSTVAHLSFCNCLLFSSASCTTLFYLHRPLINMQCVDTSVSNNFANESNQSSFGLWMTLVLLFWPHCTFATWALLGTCSCFAPVLVTSLSFLIRWYVYMLRRWCSLCSEVSCIDGVFDRPHTVPAFSELTPFGLPGPSSGL